MPGPDGHVVVVGLMGSGKTTVGRALAAALDRRFVDGDELLAGRHGTTAAALARDQGLEALHRVEQELLLDALRDPEPAVIAPAASVVDEPEGREALATPSVRVVWLRAPVAVLARRADGSDHRPLDADPAGVLARQEAVRAPRYAALADRVVDVGDTSAEAVARELAAWLR